MILLNYWFLGYCLLLKLVLMPEERGMGTMALFSKPELRQWSENPQTSICVAHAIRYKWYRKEGLPWLSQEISIHHLPVGTPGSNPYPGNYSKLAYSQPDPSITVRAGPSFCGTRQSPHIPSDLISTLILCSQWRGKCCTIIKPQNSLPESTILT